MNDLGIDLHKKTITVEALNQDRKRGGWVDFHSLRYTLCTWMAKRHPLEVVQRLMRQSTIRLTADVYNDLGLEDIGKTVWTLPPLFPSDVNRPTAGLTAA